MLSVSDEALKTGDKNVGAGSLHVDDDELAAAFDFFDVEGRGKLTVADLKARLGAFYKNLPSKEYKALISEVADARFARNCAQVPPGAPPRSPLTARRDAPHAAGATSSATTTR